MKKLRNRKNFIKNKSVAIIFIALMFIVVGFAVISTTLGITSNSTIGKITFDVHFENLKIKEGSMIAKTPATINGDDKTKIDFSLDLKTPGQYYEFISDIVNKGTLDAKVNLVKVDGLTEEQRKYIKVSYKYLLGAPIENNDLLKSGDKASIKVRVEFLRDINVEDLPGTDEPLNLTFETEFIQDDGTGIEKDKSTAEVAILGQNMLGSIDSMSSEFVSSPTGIDFGINSSDTNGKGLYLRAGTENDEYPIYYYRGEVENNHVLFGGYCWKIVRTTEQGGTKLIYDGVANSNQCNNTGTASQIGTSVYSTNVMADSDTLAGVGYMYGTRYSYTSWKDTAYVYGSDVTYNNGVYTLTNPSSSNTIANVKTKHYTCRLTTSGTCATVYYVHSFSSYYNDVYAIALTEGKKLEHIINESFANSHDSALKSTIDTWFSNNLVDQERKLEDAVWCNDRSISSGGYLKNYDLTLNSGLSNFNVMDRNMNYLPSPNVSYSPYIKNNEVCQNPNDRFTVNDTTNGNGALTYPVGTLTAEEAILAGAWFGGESSSYLINGQGYWIMSPANTGNKSYGFQFTSSGGLYGYTLYSSLGVRPSIVLKKGIVAISGNGTASNPYVVE